MPQTTTVRAVLLGTAIIIAGCSDSKNVSDPGRGNDPADPSYQKTLQVRNDVQIVSATGDITAAVNEYRALLGDASIRTSRESSLVGVARSTGTACPRHSRTTTTSPAISST